MAFAETFKDYVSFRRLEKVGVGHARKKQREQSIGFVCDQKVFCPVWSIWLCGCPGRYVRVRI